MRRALVVVAGLLSTASAHAAPPAVVASASPASGVAPLAVTLTASGDAASYTWELGDGTTAAGPEVRHVYGPGRFVATVTATSSAGEAAQAQVVVTAAARTVTLDAPLAAGYGDVGVLGGRLVPAVRGARVQIYRGRTHVASTRVRAGGTFSAKILLRSPGPYHARYGPARSAARTVTLRPTLTVLLPGATPLGSTIAVRPRLAPAGAGTVEVRVNGRPARRLPTGRPGTIRVEVVSRPRPGWAAVRRVLTTQVVHPSLARGSRGPSVLALERRLAELTYVLRGVDSVYGHDTYEAVLAFQKVHGLPRTGKVEPWLWRRLASAHAPRAVRGGSYLEVDKTRQVLFVVRRGVVTKTVHVSTGATGNTPLGSWRVYRKVGGWDWVLWYPLYFKGGFAIHGYPSVPAYPASHGCVRIPMWIAPSLFETHGYGTTVLVRL